MTKLVSTIIAEIMETNVLIELQQKKIKALHMLLSQQLKEKDIGMTEIDHMHQEENKKNDKNKRTTNDSNEDKDNLSQYSVGNRNNKNDKNHPQQQQQQQQHLNNHQKSTSTSSTTTNTSMQSSTSTSSSILMRENLKIYTDYPIRFSRIMMIYYDPYKRRKAHTLYKIVTVVDSKGYFHLYDGVEGVEIQSMHLEHNHDNNSNNSNTHNSHNTSIHNHHNNNDNNVATSSINDNNNSNSNSSTNSNDSSNNNSNNNNSSSSSTTDQQTLLLPVPVVVTAVATDSTDAHYPVFVSAASDGSIHVVTLQAKIASKRKVTKNNNYHHVDNDDEPTNTIVATLSVKFFLSQKDDTAINSHTSSSSSSSSSGSTSKSKITSYSDSTIVKDIDSVDDQYVGGGGDQNDINKLSSSSGGVAYVTAMAVISKSKSGCMIYTGDSWGRLSKFTCHGRQLNVLTLHSPIHHSPVRALALHNNWVAAAVDNTAQVVDVGRFRKMETDCQASELIQKLQFGESSAGQLLAQLQSGATVVFNFFLVGSPTSPSAGARVSHTGDTHGSSAQANSLNNILSPTRKIRPVCSITPLPHPSYSDSHAVPLQQSDYHLTEPPIMGVGLGYIKYFFLTVSQCDLYIYNSSQSTRQNIVSELVEHVNYKTNGCQEYGTQYHHHHHHHHHHQQQQQQQYGNHMYSSSSSSSTGDAGLTLQVFNQPPPAARNKGGIAGVLSMIAPSITGSSGSSGSFKNSKDTTQILITFNEFSTSSSTSFYNHENPKNKNKHNNGHDGNNGHNNNDQPAVAKAMKGNPMSQIYCHLTKTCNNNNHNNHNDHSTSTTVNDFTEFRRGVIILHDNSKMMYTRPRLLNNPFMKNNNNKNDNGDDDDVSSGMTKVGMILIAAFLIIAWRKYMNGNKNRNNRNNYNAKSKFDALSRRKGFGSSGSSGSSGSGGVGSNNIDLNSFEYCQPSKSNSGPSMMRR